MRKTLTPLARSLRRDATNAERHLWQGLRRKQVAGFRFRRQVVLGGFIAEFASFDARLVVEVDGATHSTNEEIYRNLDGVLETIYIRLLELRPRTEDPSI